MKSGRLFFMTWVVSLFSITFFSPTLALENLPTIVKKIEPFTVLILTYNAEGKAVSQGSGFFISNDGDVITNYHVLEGAKSAVVKMIDGKTYPIKQVVAEDKEWDIVRISVDIPKHVVHSLPVSSALPQVGERIVVIGSPLGFEQTVTDGIVSAVREIPTFGKIIQITAPISHGSSGSPVVNMKGDVAGVAAFIMGGGQNLNFAIPGERIVKLKVDKGKSLAEWGAEREEWIGSAEGLFYQGLLAFRRDYCKEAIPLFEQAAIEDKNRFYVSGYFLIGYCNIYLGLYTEAEEALKKTIRIKPDYADAYFYLGITYRKLGRHMEEADAFKQAIHLKSDYAEAYSELGTAYSGLKHNQEAVEALKQAIRIKPDLAEAHHRLGVTYNTLGRYTEAVEALKQAIRIKPDYADSYVSLGFAYFQLKHNQEAVEALKQAIRIKPDYAWAHYFLGLTYLMLSDSGAALNQYKMLKELDSALANKLFNLIYK